MNLSTFDAFKRLKSADAIELEGACLRQLQLTLVGIMRDVFACCERHGLTCVVGGGTALGAVRHGGFIPWDDDVDLNLPRRDYEAFVRHFRADYGERYWVHTPADTKRFGLALARVRLKGTSVCTREDLVNEQAECGAFVDIFIVENTFDNAVLRGIHGFGSMALGFLYSCRKIFFERRFIRRWAGENAAFSAAFRLKLAIGFFTAVLSLDRWVRLWDRWNALCGNDCSRLVTIPVGRRHFWGELCPRAEMCETRDMAFEGLTVKAPARVEDYMRRNYGADYLTPPPEGAREKHIVFPPFVLPDVGRELVGKGKEGN